MVRTSRRSVLAALAGSVTLGGCGSVLGSTGGEPVRVLCAGSLQNALLGLDSRVSASVEVEARGSAAAARLVADGVRDPDVVALADAALFETVLDPAWYARIATNELVLAYDATTDAGKRIEAADEWFEPFVAGDGRLGRTDPDLDPLGYRTLFALELAAAHYDRPGLRADVLAASDVYPETSLLARLDTGAVGAAVVYRSMALDRGYDTVDLPAAVDLSEPAHADSYASVSYELPDGTRVTGALVDYAATVRHGRAAGVETFDVIASGELLADHGFLLPDRYPAFEGDVPDDLR